MYVFQCEFYNFYLLQHIHDCWLLLRYKTSSSPWKMNNCFSNWGRVLHNFLGTKGKSWNWTITCCFSQNLAYLWNLEQVTVYTIKYMRQSRKITFTPVNSSLSLSRTLGCLRQIRSQRPKILSMKAMVKYHVGFTSSGILNEWFTLKAKKDQKSTVIIISFGYVWTWLSKSLVTP